MSDIQLDMHSLLQMMLHCYIGTPGIMHSKQFMHMYLATVIRLGTCCTRTIIIASYSC